MNKHFYMEWDSQTDEELREAPFNGELIEFESIHTTAQWIAEDAAKATYEDAGCDLADPKHWPIKFHIYDSEKNYVGLFSVEMEYSPDFYAHEVNRGEQNEKAD